jgi:acetyl-CoA carboxylase biotin carboxyl carrier protein
MAVLEVKSEITGSVWKIETKVGAKVEEEDVLLVIESMKMEIPIMAPQAGIVKEIMVKEGDSLSEGNVAVILEV